MYTASIHISKPATAPITPPCHPVRPLYRKLDQTNRLNQSGDVKVLIGFSLSPTAAGINIAPSIPITHTPKVTGHAMLNFFAGLSGLFIAVPLLCESPRNKPRASAGAGPCWGNVRIHRRAAGPRRAIRGPARIRLLESPYRRIPAIACIFVATHEPTNSSLKAVILTGP